MLENITIAIFTVILSVTESGGGGFIGSAICEISYYCFDKVAPTCNVFKR